MGVRSFGDAATTLLAPVLAAAVLSLAGLPWVLGCDLAAFALAFPCVFFLVRLPAGPRGEKKPLRADLREGARWLRGCPGMRVLVVGIALINLFSRLTYENVLTPMALSPCLRALGFALRRFKTGTPARVDGRTVDFSVMSAMVLIFISNHLIFPVFLIYPLNIL